MTENTPHPALRATFPPGGRSNQSNEKTVPEASTVSCLFKCTVKFRLQRGIVGHVGLDLLQIHRKIRHRLHI